MLRSLRFHWLAAFLFLLAWSPSGEAQQLRPIDPDIRFTEQVIGVLPVRTISTSIPLFVSKPVDGESGDEEGVSNLATYAVDALRLDPRFRALGPSAIQSVLESDPSRATAVELVRERYEMALELYDMLAVEKAVQHLEEATSHGQKLYLELTNPKLMARIQFLTGMCHLERGRAGKAHIAFKSAFHLHPHRTFRSGYHPASTEAALQSAREDAFSEPREPWPMERSRIQTLIQSIPLSHVVQFTRGEKGIGWVATDGIRTWRENPILFDEHDEVESRVVSKWMSCVEGRRAKPRFENYQREFRLDTNLAHGVFLDQPTREMGHVFGVVTNGSFRFNRYLDMAVKIGVSTLFQDPLEDLRSSVTLVQASLTPGFSFRSGPWMWFFRTGLEALYMDPYKVQTNPDCKFFGVDSERCPTGNSIEEKQRVLLGLPLLAGGSLNLTDSVFVSLTTSFHIFRSSLLTNSAFNSLLQNELGIGFRFH